MSYLERYKKGEYEQVWAELLALGGAIREEPLYTDALAVARETMGRVRSNVELLHQRLKDLNYQFVYPAMAYMPPERETNILIRNLERKGGTLPLSVRVFFEKVGTVDFLGSHPKLSEYVGMKRAQPYELQVYSDPLVLTPPDSDELEDYEIDVSFDTENIDENGKIITPYSLEVAPDEVHKAGYSGGAPYEIYFPDFAIDAQLQNWTQQVTFVEYLRICFQWGGFPGLASIKETSQSIVPKEELAFLTAGLKPF